MTTYMLVCLAAFGGSLLHALVLTRWAEMVAGAWQPRSDEAVLDLQMVSLIVPARNAADTLIPLLQDLYAQQWPKEWTEVLVVDDGSTDTTAALVRGMMPRWPGLRLISATGAGKKAAISQGVEEARGAWVVLTDADARCGPQRVRCIMAQAGPTGPDMLLMPVETRSAGGILQGIQADEQAALLGAAVGMALAGRPLLANGANMAFRKEAFTAVGGFQGDTWASGDDVLLLRRMVKAGRKVRYLLDAGVLVSVQAERDATAFLRQRMRWAGNMRRVGGPGAWVALAALLLPWYLLYASTAFSLAERTAQRPGACLLLLVGAWLLWLLPILGLLREVQRFLHAAGSPVRGPGALWSRMCSYIAFHCYAPLIAVAAWVVRPEWKGRSL